MKTLISALKSLIGNKSAEKDIRDWLSQQGYVGKTAQFAEVELHAIKRPGWLQIFRFETSCMTAEGERAQLFGAMRSDERYGAPQILVDADLTVRDQQLATWSDGLITHKRRRK